MKVHGDNKFAMFSCVTPAGERESIVWLIMALNYTQDVPPEELRRFQDVVTNQDVPVVESQRPELLPLDLQAVSPVARMAVVRTRQVLMRRRCLASIGACIVFS